MSDLEGSRPVPSTADQLAELFARSQSPDRYGTRALDLLATSLADRGASDGDEDELARIHGLQQLLGSLSNALDVDRNDGRGMDPRLSDAGHEAWSSLTAVLAAARPTSAASLRRSFPLLGDRILRETGRGRPHDPRARCEALTLLEVIGYPYTVTQLDAADLAAMCATKPWPVILLLAGARNLEPTSALDLLADLIVKQNVAMPARTTAAAIKLLLGIGDPGQRPSSPFLRRQIDRLMIAFAGQAPDFVSELNAQLSDLVRTSGPGGGSEDKVRHRREAAAAFVLGSY